MVSSSEIYIYDNNSTDGTDRIARENGAIVRYEYKQGKGNVIRRMFREVDALCYIMVDGDDTYPSEYGRKMADQVLKQQIDMVVGDRLSSTYFQENKRPFHNIGNSLVRKSINFLFECNIKDIMTGYRAFSFQFVKTFPVLSKGFEIETEMTIHAVDKNMSIGNVVIEYRDRPEGSVSKLNTYTDGIKVIKKILHLYRTYRPMSFFGTISVFFFAIAVILFVPIFAAYLSTGIVLRFPTLIISGFLVLSSLNSLFSGMILTNMRIESRHEYENRLQWADAIQKEYIKNAQNKKGILI